MNFFRRSMLRLALKGADLTLADPAGWEFLLGSGPTWSNVSVDEKTQLQVAASFSAIRLISETVGILPLPLYQKTESGRRKATDHPLYDLVHTQPNEYMTSIEWKESMAVSLATMGQSYNLTSRFESSGRVTSIQPIHKSKIQPEFMSDGTIVYWHTDRNGNRKSLKRADVCPIRGFGNVGQLEGFAPHHLHANTLGMSQAIEKYGAEFFGSGGRPKGVLSTADSFKDEQRDAIRKNFNKYVKESWLSGELPVLERGLKYEAVTTPNNEAQFIETRNFIINEIARIYRVPNSLLMQSMNDSKSANEQFNKHFLDFTLMPYLVRIEQGLNSCLLTAKERAQGFYFQFDTRGLLRGDSASRSAYYLALRQAAAITANEIRDLEDMPRIEGADELFVPLNMAPLDLIRNIQDPNQG